MWTTDSSLEHLILLFQFGIPFNTGKQQPYLFCILQGKKFSCSEECIEKLWREALLETLGSSLSLFPSPSSLNPGTFVVGICSLKPCSNISFHFHDNSSLSTSEGTCLYCKQTSLGNWPVFFLYLIFHLLKGFASKRSRLQVCTFSFLTLPFCFWKRSILEIKILSTSDFNNLTEKGWVPVCTCELIFGAYQHVTCLVPF